MDQESFRRLLQTPHAGTPSSATTSRGGFFSSTASKTKAKVLDPSQPAFKPRKVKKPTEGPYRDRAAERRVGEGNDYAQVEAVLEDFEKRNSGQDKSSLDAQRHYLGGDGAHSVLVKGLDMSLLEQNRARAMALSTEDDDSLEQAFLEATDAAPSVPRKRTREDLLRELKEKRGQPIDETAEVKEQVKGKGKTREEEARLLEQAKQAGKFKPIGFKPIGTPAAEPKKGMKKKKVKGEDGQAEGERKKKKRKVAGAEGGKDVVPPSTTITTPATTTTRPPKPRTPEPEHIPQDFDIFADAEEYEGLQLGDSDSEDEATKPGPSKPRDLEEGEQERDTSPPPPSGARRWIDTGSPEPEPAPSAKSDLLSSVLASTSASVSTGPDRGRPGEADEEEEGEAEQPMGRLVPLASSALPSIKEFLAMEKAASGGGKRKQRKGGGGGGEKKAGGGGEGGEEGKKKKDAEAKAERDYKRLKNYTDKKAAT
ncbi:hypothetical protein FPV67DRAFT_1650065 [Lyophyllum atratum]|nr:hypothetical protein FPV67DRAFT_1650065 [Lyophyllum atratum]